MKDVNIRSCAEEDFPFVFELLKQLWPGAQLDTEMLQRVYERALNSDKQKLIVGLIDGKIAGFCSLTVKNNLWLAGNLGHIDELIVDKRFRGRGIGKKLMDGIIKIARENDCKRVELDSAFHREDAHRFYEDLGFENRAYLFSKSI